MLEDGDVLRMIRKRMGLGDTLGALPPECGGTGNMHGGSIRFFRVHACKAGEAILDTGVLAKCDADAGKVNAGWSNYSLMLQGFVTDAHIFVMSSHVTDHVSKSGYTTATTLKARLEGAGVRTLHGGAGNRGDGTEYCIDTSADKLDASKSYAANVAGGVETVFRFANYSNVFIGEGASTFLVLEYDKKQ